MQHSVFITGCATGFGNRLAKRLLDEGHRVVATDRVLGDWTDGLQADGDRLLAMACDVRDADSVERAVSVALDFAPIDTLVNNAGYAIFGTQEEVDTDAVQDLFDVNVVGLARVTRALMPALRDRRGMVIQLSSVAGRTVFPESGYYAATKYAVEALTEALFQETCTFGVRVRLIQPGSFDTQFLPTAVRLSPPRSDDSPYAELRTQWDARKQDLLEPPQDPNAVVEAILMQMDDPAPFRRVPVGPDAVRMLQLRDACSPDEWSLLAAARNGLQPVPAGVPTPERVLEAQRAGNPPPELARRAFALGHLNHWAQDEQGRLALQFLAGFAA